MLPLASNHREATSPFPHSPFCAAPTGATLVIANCVPPSSQPLVCDPHAVCDVNAVQVDACLGGVFRDDGVGFPGDVGALEGECFAQAFSVHDSALATEGAGPAS